jgi:hypothetical protein
MNKNSSAESADYYRGFHEGFMAARNAPTTIPTQPITYKYDKPITNVPIQPVMYANRCTVCGIDFKNATHYVCNNIGCPTKVTCTTGATGGGTTTFANTVIGYNVNNLADNNMSALMPEMITTIKTTG